MKQIKKRKLTKKQLLLIVTSSVLALLIAATAIVTSLVDTDQGTDSTAEPPEILEGEALYANMAVAYPRIAESDITYILVQNKEGSFDLTRTGSDGSFWLGYDVGGGARDMMLHTPPIMSAEGSFDYKSLYATESGDNYGNIYKLTYLATAIGTPYFSERIVLPENRAEREAQLAAYGFKKETQETVSFFFRDPKAGADAKEQSHSITIGGKAVSGAGFYFMVDNRNYVYYTNLSYFEYALRGFHTFINGRLIAEGIASDSVYEPFLTTDFKEWVKEKHAEEGERVASGANVIVSGYSYIPKITEPGYKPPAGSQEDGYEQLKYTELTFDLEKLKAHPDIGRITSTLTALSVGKLTDSVMITLPDEHAASESMRLDLSDGKSVKYKYSITEIESVIRADAELTAKGTPTANERYLKVTYHPYVMNEKGEYELATALPRHAIIDLNNPLIPREAAEELRAAEVGYINPYIVFEVEYDSERAVKKTERTVIDSILEIYSSNGAAASKITENSLVILKCHDEINGVAGEERTWHLKMSSLSTVKNGEKIKEVLLGKGKTNKLNAVVFEDVTYYQALVDFTAYRVEEIKYFITSELVTSFRFVNASDRDPYYGESFYENTMQDEHRFYGLNASACEHVVQYLGGVGSSGTVASEGFVGETVAVGLTHETMEKYGLYAYEIYFELPRGIQDISEGTEGDASDMLSDYSWYGELGFTLYISEKQYDPDTSEPFRYVGSDMYDIVARVDGTDLDFVEFSFEEFWARRHLMMTDIGNIEEIKVDFGMKELYGSYRFEIEKRDLYVGTTEDNKMHAEYYPFEGATKTNKYYVNISSSGVCMDTEFKRILNAPDYKYDVVSVSNLYNEVQNGGKPLHHSIVDTEGVAQFKNAVELTQLTQYTGLIDELGDELRDMADASMNAGAPELRISFRLAGSSYFYTYEFFRFGDRCVAVRLYRTDASGNAVSARVSDFYISTLSFKKIVTAYHNLLMGKTVDIGAGYGG